MAALRPLIAFAFILLSFSLPAKADDWSHIRLRSAEGVNINVDYIATRKAGRPNLVQEHNAGPLYVNVSGGNLRGYESVRVILNNQQVIPYLSGRGGWDPISYWMDLTWYGDHFSAEISDSVIKQSFVSLYPALPMTIFLDGHGGTYRFDQELSVIVDGRALIDPISGSPSFRFNLFNQATTFVSLRK